MFGSVGGSYTGRVRGDGCEVLILWVSTGGCWAVNSLATAGTAVLAVQEAKSFMQAGGIKSFGKLGPYGHRVGGAVQGTSEDHVGNHVKCVSGAQ